VNRAAEALPGADAGAAVGELAARWADALLAAALVAVDPAGLGGAVLRARTGAQRECWLAELRALMPEDVPLRRMPLHIADERLLGGLDLAATLAAGRPVAQRGLLAECNGGVVLVAMAERVSPTTAARLAQVVDRGEVVLERDGLAQRMPARFGLVLLDEGLDDDEQAPPGLVDRLAFHLALDELPSRAPCAARAGPETVAAARARLARLDAVDEEVIQALCEAAGALGIASPRAPWLALRVARAAAALAGHDAVEADDLGLAARLVLAPRATRMPTAEVDDPPPPPPAEPPAPPPDAQDSPPPETDDAEPPPLPDQPLEDIVLEAALASLPAHVLARLKAGLGPRGATPTGGRFGAVQVGHLRGRPIGARRGELRPGTRLDLVATLRAAAPWQGLRAREAAAAEPGSKNAAPRRVRVRRDDFHISRTTQRRETTTVFVVDASGSAALHRLGEAKGAVELLLADCYVRRDRVALIAFRGSGAELLLPPTRSLVRAKRALAGLPGGGGTPLAAALDATGLLTAAILRRGGTPVVVLLTDGRANIARDGSPGRPQAQADALLAARQFRAAGVTALLVDTSPTAAGSGAGQGLAQALGAQFLALPRADAATLSRNVQAVARQG
jgi:magnesium chelatase subunit D